jgi:tetratricopeptide (TPR) repeat protein
MTYKHLRYGLHYARKQAGRLLGQIQIYRKCVGACLLGFSLMMSGCANVSGLFAEQDTPVESEQDVQSSDLTQKDAEQNTLENLSSEAIAASEQAAAEALAAQQQRDKLLALVNAPNRFTESKRSNTGVSKTYLIQALEAYQDQRFEEALGLIATAKADPAPLNSGAYVLSGDVYLALAEQKLDANAMQDGDQNLLSLAEQSFDSALSLNPHNYKAANRRALLHREKGEFTEALRLYDSAIQAYPGHAVSYRNRGVLYDLYLGNKTAALDDYRTYSEILEFQQAYQAQSETVSGVLLKPAVVSEFAEPKVLQRELRQVKGWQLDIERQIQTQSKTSASRRLEQDNGLLAVNSLTHQFLATPRESL